MLFCSLFSFSLNHSFISDLTLIFFCLAFLYKSSFPDLWVGVMVQSNCCNFTELSHCFCEVLECGACFLKFLGFVLLLFEASVCFILSLSLVCGVFSGWELWWFTFKSSWEQDFVLFSSCWRFFSSFITGVIRISVSAVLRLTCHDFLWTTVGCFVFLLFVALSNTLTSVSSCTDSYNVQVFWLWVFPH